MFTWEGGGRRKRERRKRKKRKGEGADGLFEKVYTKVLVFGGPHKDLMGSS